MTMKTPENRSEMIDLLMGARTLPEIEATNKLFDQWLMDHPEEDDINSPVWQALGLMARIKNTLEYLISEGVDIEAERARIEAEVAEIIAEAQRAKTPVAA
ncbi:MAG: hypothetical protein M3347_15970 [Armatimonadota bacterium]|nr:hypothetical protein [Armatimonadota bacterium]